MPIAATPKRQKRSTPELPVQPTFDLDDYGNLSFQELDFIIAMNAYDRIIEERRAAEWTLITCLAIVRTLRARLAKNPPPEIAYVAGAIVAARTSFGWLLDEWAWHKSQLRNWMIANGLNDVVCTVAGQRIRASLTPNRTVICTCHFQEMQTCKATMDLALRGEPLSLRTIDNEPRLEISVL